MEKKKSIMQIYGIIVCIVSIITFIICLSILVSSIITRSEPLYSGYSQKDLSSFETYKVEVLSNVKKDQAYIPDDATIIKMYEAAKTEKINRVLHTTKTSIIVSSMLLFFSLLLFITHWMIIRRSGKV